LFSGWKIRGKDKARKQNNERQNDAFSQIPSRSGSHYSAINYSAIGKKIESTTDAHRWSEKAK
jgi:hypothetical protein